MLKRVISSVLVGLSLALVAPFVNVADAADCYPPYTQKCTTGKDTKYRQEAAYVKVLLNQANNAYAAGKYSHAYYLFSKAYIKAFRSTIPTDPRLKKERTELINAARAGMLYSLQAMR